MYKLILCFVMMLFLSGCQDQPRLDNQIKNQIEYKTVFLNSPNCITVLTVEQKNPEIIVAKMFYSRNKIKFITNSEKKIITWHAYHFDSCSDSCTKWDVAVHISDLSNLEAGELDKGKFGKEKLIKVQ